VKFELKPNEQVLYPSPFVPEEHNPLIVSTHRLIWTGDGKKKEVPADKIHYAGKGFHQKFMIVMGVLFLLGAPFFGYGAITYYLNKDKPTEPPAAVKGMPQKPLTAKEKQTFEDNAELKTRAIVCGIFGAAFLGVAYLLFKRRLTVIVGGGGKALSIPVKDKAMQDKMLMMINAAQTSAKAMAAPAAAMPNKVQKAGGAPPPKLSK
jgi:hypothetical protein